MQQLSRPCQVRGRAGNEYLSSVFTTHSLALTPCLSIYQAACIHIRDHWWIFQSGGLHYNISVPVDQEQDAAEGSNGQLLLW